MRDFRRPHRLKRNKPIFKQKFFAPFILAFSVILVLLYFFYLSGFFQVKEIEVIGNLKVETEKIRETYKSIINNKFLFFETKSIFLVDLSKGDKNLLNEFPSVAEVESKKSFPGKLVVELEERQPAVLLSVREEVYLPEEEDLLEVIERYYFVDREGVVFEEAFDENLVEIRKEEMKDICLGENVLPQEHIEKIFKVKDGMNGLKVNIEEFILLDDERVDALTEEGWKVYFNFSEDVDWQLTKLKVVLEEKISPEKREILEYIDLRFGNFAPYK